MALRRFLIHPRVLVSLVVLIALALPLGVLAHGRSEGQPRVRMIAAASGGTLTRVVSSADFGAGIFRGTGWAGGALRLTQPMATVTVGGVRYQSARWTARWTVGAEFTELVPSWSARTPSGSWVRMLVRVRDTQGRVSRFKDLGRWSVGDTFLKRRSSGSQADALVTVSTDTLRAQPGVRLNGYQLRMQLLRRVGHAGPAVRSVSAIASVPPGTPATVSQPVSSTPVSLAVPGYSQMIHRGQDPEFGGGGEAWCSPTSLSMILGYYGRLPSPASYRWVKASYADRWVNAVARMTYDYRYGGTGNWPFNTAAGANRVGDAFVTRLTDLRMAEPFLRAGIPLAVSIQFSRGQLAGAPISASAGHLVVLAGLTASGNPIVMDPAAPSDATVQRTYDRAQFERAWIGGSGGTAYVLHDAAHPLPPAPAGVQAW